MDREGERINRLELEREFLASERTYLAWLRTAMNVMALGVAVAKLGPEEGPSAAAGGILVGAGTVGLLYGTTRYRRVIHELRQGRFTTGTRGRGPEIAATVLTAAVLTALALIVVA